MLLCDCHLRGNGETKLMSEPECSGFLVPEDRNALTGLLPPNLYSVFKLYNLILYLVINICRKYFSKKLD